MKQYHDLLINIKNNGRQKGDRTGTGTISTFGDQMRFDMKDGFPLVTTKKVYHRAIVHELLWMLSGDTNDNYLVSNNVNIWREWSKSSSKYPDDKRILIEVNQRILEKHSVDIRSVDIICDLSQEEIYASEETASLYHVWWRMIDRCYNENAHNYRFYGGSGVFVDVSWHSCKQFIEDCSKLQNWQDKKTNWSSYQLDKDYYSSNCYSINTCVWLHTKENCLYTKVFAPFEIVIDNKRIECLSLQDGKTKTGIPRTSLGRLLITGVENSTAKFVKDLKVSSIKHLQCKPNNSLRLRFSTGELGPVYGAQWRNWNNEGIDQIANAIERLKTNPDCRRIIVNAWNPSVLPDTSKSFDENVANGKAALPPCHSFFQFYSQELTEEERLALLNKAENYVPKRWDESSLDEDCKAYNIPSRILSLKLYQRSVDTFLGLPFNIAFYAILLEMAAAQTNMVVGDFIHSSGDCHIYNNHIEQIDLQLSREPLPLPTLWLNPDVKSIFDYKFEDIEIRNYQSHEPIKGAVSV